MTRSASWESFAGRFAKPKIYWLATVTPAGAPHSVPVWGVVVDGAIYLYSERTTVKAHNLAVNDGVVVHLESGSDVVIVTGRAVEVTAPNELDSVRASFVAKYNQPSEVGYVPTSDPLFIIWRVEPTRALTWQLEDVDGSQRRWVRPTS